jgi:hypothetical protein
MLLGAGWLVLRGKWAAFDQLRPRLPGKLTTAAQLLFLLLVLYQQRLLLVFLATAGLSGLAAVDYLWDFLRRP